MVGIVFATYKEAQPLLDRSAGKVLTRRPFPLYRIGLEASSACQVIISGMGKVAATMAGAYLVMQHGAGVLISAGLCGRLSQDRCLAVGDLFRITHAVEGDCDRFGRHEKEVSCDPQWFRQLPGARLVTCDRPVFDTQWRGRLAALGDVADMEGAAVARVADRLGIACAMVKGISDAADAHGREAVADNMDWVSARIAGVLMDELVKMTHSKKNEI
jgi:nucleoside phosphorylase